MKKVGIWVFLRFLGHSLKSTIDDADAVLDVVVDTVVDTVADVAVADYADHYFVQFQTGNLTWTTSECLLVANFCEAMWMKVMPMRRLTSGSSGHCFKAATYSPSECL